MILEAAISFFEFMPAGSTMNPGVLMGSSCLAASISMAQDLTTMQMYKNSRSVNAHTDLWSSTVYLMQRPT
jgi:hypothetical protein